MAQDERVLVVAVDWLRRLADFQGFLACEPDVLARLLDARQVRYLPRQAVETDPRWKQLIPYVVLSHGNSVFVYTRGQAGSEHRLHARQSLGVGGHVNDADGLAPGLDAYRLGLLRELSEEVAWSGSYAETFLGLINDDSTPVGQVHLGVAHRWHMNEATVTAREGGLLDAHFEPLAQVRAQRLRFESWSQFLLDAGRLDA